MVHEVLMPSLGQINDEATIIRWLVKEGDKVQKGQPLLEVETDKATLEVEAFRDGFVRKIKHYAGEKVKSGTVLVHLTDHSDEVVSEREDTVNDQPGETKPGTKVKALPSARRLAEEKGVKIEEGASVVDSEIITAQDVLSYLQQSKNIPGGTGDYQNDVVTIITFSKMRKTIGDRLQKSQTQSPHFYMTAEIIMDQSFKLKEYLNRKPGETKISFTDVIIKALALALTQFSLLNATVHEEEIHSHKAVNLGLAVAVEEGLLVPVLYNVAELDLIQISLLREKVVNAARTGNLRLEEMKGSTFTLSNLGTVAVDAFTAIIDPPETGILAVGRVAPRPVVINGRVEAALTLKATLSVDHRVVDGLYAARFLEKMKDLLEHPYELVGAGVF